MVASAVCGGGGGAHVTQLLQLALAPTQRREIGREIALEIGREVFKMADGRIRVQLLVSGAQVFARCLACLLLAPALHPSLRRRHSPRKRKLQTR